jgi:hypothetical protein
VTDPLDFNGSWRDDLLQQQRVRFLAAETQTEQRAAADLILQLREWKQRRASLDEAAAA